MEHVPRQGESGPRRQGQSGGDGMDDQRSRHAALSCTAYGGLAGQGRVQFRLLFQSGGRQTAGGRAPVHRSSGAGEALQEDAGDRPRRRAMAVRRQLEAERGLVERGEELQAATVLFSSLARRDKRLINLDLGARNPRVGFGLRTRSGTPAVLSVATMLGYIVRRLLALIPVLLGLTFIVFAIMALIPGDPALAILGSYATPESLAALRAQMGLDHSLPVQYLIWLDNILHGDFGRSYSLNRPVLDEVVERFRATLILSTTAFALCSVWGVLAGVGWAVRQNGWVDRLVTLFVLIGISIPSFWLGLLLILLFVVRLRWLPASGMVAIYGGGDLLDLTRHLILPATTLSVVPTGVIARLTRANMLEVLRQDYVRTARAKGVAERFVIFRHAFK